MLRRSFRVGLFMGILGGLAFALVKALQTRREPSTLAPGPSPTWPPMRDTAPPSPPRTPPATREREDTGAATVVAEPVEAPPDEPHEKEVPTEAAAPTAPPPPVARAAQTAKATRKAATKSARRVARKAAPSAPPAPERAWVEPSGNVCPPSHPVKGKLASKIFHLPGQLNYDRTTPDRCYKDADTATGDGLRQSKR